MGRGLFSISRGGIISRSTHLILDAYFPCTYGIHSILKMKKRIGGKRINHTLKATENMYPMTEKKSPKGAKRVSIGVWVR
jgi:NifU-like protein involved in Fe-S cluster formation